MKNVKNEFRKKEFYQDRQAIGTESYHRIGLSRKVIFTDGTKIMFEKLSCFWLCDIICSYASKLKVDEFYTVYFILDEEKSSGVFYITDGNYDVLIEQVVPFTDIESNIQMFIAGNGEYLVGMLPTEY